MARPYGTAVTTLAGLIHEQCRVSISTGLGELAVAGPLATPGSANPSGYTVGPQAGAATLRRAVSEHGAFGIPF